MNPLVANNTNNAYAAPAKEKAPKAVSEFEKSLKSNDTEEKIDIWFYRPIGLKIAKFCAKTNISPNTVTIVSIYIGVAAGIFFYFDNIWINIVGMLLLMFANSLDSADGQLARLTNNKSRYGRILDGMAGDFWFVSIGISLCLRLMHAGWSPWIWIVVFMSGFSHLIQSAMSDYYRNVYLYFLKGEAGSELDSSENLDEMTEELGRKKQYFKRFVISGYRNYTQIQEKMTPFLQKLLLFNKENPGSYEAIRKPFLHTNRPLMPLTNIIQFNTRVIFLFVWLFMDQVWLYFIFDVVVLNSIFFYLRFKQEQSSKNILAAVKA